VQIGSLFFLILLGKQLTVEHIFEYNRSMELGDPTAPTREPCSRLDEAFDQFDAALPDLITGVSTPNASSAITTDTADGKTPHDHPTRSRTSSSPIGAALAQTSADSPG